MQLNNLNARLSLTPQQTNKTVIQTVKNDPTSAAAKTGLKGTTFTKEFGNEALETNSLFGIGFWWRIMIGLGSDWGVSFPCGDNPNDPRFRMEPHVAYTAAPAYENENSFIRIDTSAWTRQKINIR